MTAFEKILNKQNFGRDDLVRFIGSEGRDHDQLIERSQDVLLSHIGDRVWLRGLIEFSNVCRKNCFYCGIRKDNKETDRYDISDDDILSAAMFAWQNKYGSIVLQCGERNDNGFIERVGNLLQLIKSKSNGELGITLSLGEQTEETYKYWRECGAHRYLLRIESSNEELYYQIHPHDAVHNFQQRLECLQMLKRTGYQVGTGVMIGLPGQTAEQLADDLLFMQKIEVDMVGMGPYLEHHQTPLYSRRNVLWPVKRRFEVALNMIAALRLLVPDINIAASTALQAIDPMGREKALKVGANIIMPNITPSINRKNYLLYDNKPCTDEGADDCSSCINVRIEMTGRKVGFGEWGDSPEYFKRKINDKTSHE